MDPRYSQYVRSEFQVHQVEPRPGRLQAFDGEVLILHGEVDHLVPAEHAVRLHQAAVRAGRRLQRMGGGER